MTRSIAKLLYTIKPKDKALKSTNQLQLNKIPGLPGCKGTGFRCVSRDVTMTTQPMRELKQSTLPGWMSHRYCYWLIPTQIPQDTPTTIAHKPLRFDSKHWTRQGAESSSAMRPLPLGLAQPLMLYTLKHTTPMTLKPAY